MNFNQNVPNYPGLFISKNNKIENQDIQNKNNEIDPKTLNIQMINGYFYASPVPGLISFDIKQKP